MWDSSVFIHEKALVDSTVALGSRTRVWAFVHILGNAFIGEDCNICDHVFVESGARIGSRVTIKCGVQIWDGVTIEDDVFIGPNVTFTNDMYPPSNHWPKSIRHTLVSKGASIGGGSTILPGITIGQNAMIGAGSVVTKSVPSGALVLGNPARFHRWFNRNQHCRPGESQL